MTPSNPSPDLVEHDLVNDRRVPSKLHPAALVTEAKVKDPPENGPSLVHVVLDVLVDAVQDEGDGAHDGWPAGW